MTDPADLPPPAGTAPSIEVDASKLKAVSITIGLALIPTIAGATTLVSLAKNRDLAGTVAWLQSEPAVPFFAGVATLAGFAALGWRSAKRKAREIYLGWHVRNSIATVPGQTTEPPRA